MHHFLVCMYILQGKSLAMIFVYQKINALKIFFFLRFGHIALYATCACTFSHIQLFATPWTVARHAPLSMGFSRHEYWSGLSFPPPGDFPDPGIELLSLVSPVLEADSLPAEPLGKPLRYVEILPFCIFRGYV